MSLKFLNKNNVLKFYRIGLFSNGFCLFVLLLLGNNVKDYIYLFAVLDCATSLLYWSAYKMILYNFKNDSQFKKIFSYNSMVTSLISIISTIGMGYIIVNASYSVLFVIIITLVLIAVITSFYFDKYEEIIINEEEDKSILYFNTKINSYEDFLRFIFNYYKNLGLPYLTWLFSNKKED